MGTPEAMYSASGKRTWSCTLNSFGKVRNFEGEWKVDCPFRYQGQYEDSETGLYYNRFRYYSPDEGMYLSQDPIRLEGGLHFYNYVDNPNAWVDFFGLKSCKEKRNIDEICKKYGGTQIGRNRYKFPSKKNARQAASEISGDLGSAPSTIRRKDYRDSRNTHLDKNQIE